VEDALRARRDSGTCDLMLGRGVLCRPDLPRLLRGRDLGTEQNALPWTAIRKLVLHYLTQILEHYDTRYAVNPIKQWLGYLRYYYPQAAELFQRIKRLQEPQAMAREIAVHPL
jgi:tRNA-dihydrouridine synthase C